MLGISFLSLASLAGSALAGGPVNLVYRDEFAVDPMSFDPVAGKLPQHFAGSLYLPTIVGSNQLISSGRLATEAEWNYASAGGGGADGQRMYPWSSPPTSTTVDDTYVVYCGASCNFVQNVGSKAPKGTAKWGQADLGGNVWEWVQDWYAATYPIPCTNCANLTTAANRVFRGGSFRDFPSSYYVSASFRSSGAPGSRLDYLGIRCARGP